MFTAHPSLRGTQIRDLKDAAGGAFGEQILRAGSAEGQVNEVSYSFPRPGTTAPAPKLSYVTRVADQVCGVGYYSSRRRRFQGSLDGGVCDSGGSRPVSGHQFGASTQTLLNRARRSRDGSMPRRARSSAAASPRV